MVIQDYKEVGLARAITWGAHFQESAGAGRALATRCLSPQGPYELKQAAPSLSHLCICEPGLGT